MFHLYTHSNSTQNLVNTFDIESEVTVIPQERLKVGMRVAYTWQVTDNVTLIEKGTVSSYNDTVIFVKYDEQVHKLGMAGATAQATYPCDLIEIEHEHNDSIVTINV